MKKLYRTIDNRQFLQPYITQQDFKSQDNGFSYVFDRRYQKVCSATQPIKVLFEIIPNDAARKCLTAYALVLTNEKYQLAVMNKDNRKNSYVSSPNYFS